MKLRHKARQAGESFFFFFVSGKLMSKGCRTEAVALANLWYWFAPIGFRNADGLPQTATNLQKVFGSCYSTQARGQEPRLLFATVARSQWTQRPQEQSDEWCKSHVSGQRGMALKRPLVPQGRHRGCALTKSHACTKLEGPSYPSPGRVRHDSSSSPQGTFFHLARLKNSMRHIAVVQRSSGMAESPVREPSVVATVRTTTAERRCPSGRR